MESYKLQNPFPGLVSGGRLYYGGNQRLSDSKTIRSSGCGVIAACDLFLYLHRYREDCRCTLLGKAALSGPVQLELYNEWLRGLRRYFPLIPHFGINGPLLTAGINRFFHRYQIPLRAVWGLSEKQQWKRMEEMLANDLPVILSIGPNLPLFWQKNKARFYTETPEGDKRPGVSVCAHYVTVTAMDEQWLTISSWGKKYYISREEYRSYVKKYSSSLVSNMVYIQRKNKKIGDAT